MNHLSAAEALRRVHGLNGGIADSLDGAKAAFRAWETGGGSDQPGQKNEPARILCAGGFLSDRRVSGGLGGGAMVAARAAEIGKKGRFR